MNAKRRRFITLSAIGGALALCIAIAGKTPKAAAKTLRVPSNPDEVLETLRGGSASQGGPSSIMVEGPRAYEISQLKKQLAYDPQNLGAALRLAHLDIQIARERSDPRYLGQAQAVLEPWWNEETQNAEVWVLRATIEQSLHDFEAALLHLDRALELEPRNAQGWITRAVVLTVRGRYEEARASCVKVRPLAEPIAFVVCATQIDSVTGRAKPAYDELQQSLAALPSTSKDVEEWAVSSLGEFAVRFGDAKIAEVHFRRALDLTPDDAYVRGALADLLLDASRFDEAAKLVADREWDDGMLLRLTIAEKMARKTGSASSRNNSFEAHRDMLTARFDASRERGDVVHRREEARYWLDVIGDDGDERSKARALDLAKANWDVQKEPWDARVYLAAASAMHSRDAAKPILDWIDKTKLEDPMIAKLASGLR